MQSVDQLAAEQSLASACAVLGVPRSSVYRHRRKPGSPEQQPQQPRPAPPRALDQAEKDKLRDLLDSERFQDLAPREVYASLLDEGVYYCSWRTMYRVLAACDQVRERRNQLRHPAYAKPELMATGANQVWSWDITKVRGPSKGLYYYLYVILDIFSRYAVGWMAAEQESAALAEQMIAETCRKQGIEQGRLTIHADNGGAMTAKSLALLMADLGVGKSHSRPHVSDDNPFSEAQFRTLKYHPDYPERFGCLTDVRSWGQRFFAWYNDEHHHTGLGLLTPADVHYGRAATVLTNRQVILQRAYEAHPERFVKGVPKPVPAPSAVWINPPKESSQAQSSPTEAAALTETVQS